MGRNNLFNFFLFGSVIKNKQKGVIISIFFRKETKRFCVLFAGITKAEFI